MVNPGILGLLGSLKDAEAPVRMTAAGSLGIVGAAGSYAPPPLLIEAYRPEDSPEVLAAIASALGQFQYEPDPAIPALLRAMEHPEPRVARSAAQSLGRLRPTAAAGPALAEGLASPRPEVRRAAFSALGRLEGPPDPATVPAVVTALGKADGATGVGPEAAAMLGRIAPGSPSAEAAVSALATALKSPDDALRRRAVEALPRFGHAATPAVPALKSLKDGDPKPEIREAAGKALATIEAVP